MPESPPALSAHLRPDHAVELSWQRTADTIGLQYELHRGTADGFTPEESTRIGLTTAGRFVDLIPPQGTQHYAMCVTSGTRRSKPVFASLEVPRAPPPMPPTNLSARPLSGEIALSWDGLEGAGLRYDVYRSQAGADPQAKLNAEALRALHYTDPDVEPGTKYIYVVRASDRRGRQSPASNVVEATPLPEIKEPVFVVQFDKKPLSELNRNPMENWYR